MCAKVNRMDAEQSRWNNWRLVCLIDAARFQNHFNLRQTVTLNGGDQRSFLEHPSSLAATLFVFLKNVYFFSHCWSSRRTSQQNFRFRSDFSETSQTPILYTTRRIVSVSFVSIRSHRFFFFIDKRKMTLSKSRVCRSRRCRLVQKSFWKKKTKIEKRMKFKFYFSWWKKETRELGEFTR